MFWLQFLARLFAPFAVGILTFQLIALVIPGQIEEKYWEYFFSLICLAAIYFIRSLLIREQVDKEARFGLLGIAIFLLGLSALLVHVHDTCTPRSKFIGADPPEQNCSH